MLVQAGKHGADLVKLWAGFLLSIPCDESTVQQGSVGKESDALGNAMIMRSSNAIPVD